MKFSFFFPFFIQTLLSSKITLPLGNRSSGMWVSFFVFGFVFPDLQLGARMCISGPCWTLAHGPSTQLAVPRRNSPCPSQDRKWPRLKLIWRANRCFCGQKWRGKIWDREIKLALFDYTFCRAPIWALTRVEWMSGTYGSKNRTKVAVTHWQNLLESFATLTFYQWNCTERWISQPIFPDRKVLWMTLKQLFKIFIKFNMFDCIGAIFICLHVASLILGPLLVRKNFSENLPVLGFNRFMVQVWTSQKLDLETWQNKLL